MSRLKDRYKSEILPELKKEWSIANDLAVPRLRKIVVNVGLGDAKDNQEIIDKVSGNITALTGQKPVVAKSKRSISNFKLSQGQPIGVVATLRGERMFDFLDKLITIVLPKVRDFRGLPGSAFDGQGNYTLGLREQTTFPEVNYQAGVIGSKVRGLEVTIVTTARDREKGRKLLELLGMPFRKEKARV